MSSLWDVRRFDEIASTNSYLLAQARAGAPAHLVAVARHQTAGRGRLDRRWESPPGANVLVSFLLRPRCEPSDLHLCTAAVALAAADACRDVADVRAALKWPNDLLVGESKVAGILAEVDFGSGPPAAVVVGLGLNVAWSGPPGAGGTSLEQSRGSALDPETVLEGVLAALGAAGRPPRPRGRTVRPGRGAAPALRHARSPDPGDPRDRAGHGDGAGHRRRRAARRRHPGGAPDGGRGRRRPPATRLKSATRRALA